MTYRLDLEECELNNLKELIKYAKSYDELQEEELYFNEELLEKVQNPKKIKHSGKKALAAEIATEARTKQAKEKIQNAINILRMEDKKLTHYSIAKMAGVSYVTVKKYIKLNEAE